MTEALTRHAGLLPVALATFGLYPSKQLFLRFLAGLVGIKYVLVDGVADKDARPEEDMPCHVLPLAEG